MDVGVDRFRIREFPENGGLQPFSPKKRRVWDFVRKTTFGPPFCTKKYEKATSEPVPSCFSVLMRSCWMIPSSPFFFYYFFFRKIRFFFAKHPKSAHPEAENPEKPEKCSSKTPEKRTFVNVEIPEKMLAKNYEICQCLIHTPQGIGAVKLPTTTPCDRSKNWISRVRSRCYHSSRSPMRGHEFA